MKKYGAIIGIAVLMLAAIITVAGCEQSTEMDANIKNWPADPKAAAVAAVTAVGSTNFIVVRCDAAQDATAYTLYVQQEGKKTVMSSYDFASSYVQLQNDYRYDNDGTQSSNDDIDKWSVLITKASANGIAGKKYRFGITASDVNGNSSDIVWSGYTVTF